MIIVTQSSDQCILKSNPQNIEPLKVLSINQVDFGDYFDSSDLALQITIAINQIAARGELIVLDQTIQIEDRIPQHYLAMLILKEIRINAYLEGTKSKIRRSNLAIQTALPLQHFFRNDPIFGLAFSPKVELFETPEECQSWLKYPKTMLSEPELNQVRHYLPIPEPIDPLDNRHNHASVRGVFQLYRFARYFYEESVELQQQYEEPAVLPESGLSSSIRDRLFIHRFNLPKGKVKIVEVKHLLDQIHKQLATSKGAQRKIALIDDEASQLNQGARLGAGWCSALNTILFTKDCVVDVLKDCHVDTSNFNIFPSKIANIIEYLKSIDPVCILLDVRLLDKETHSSDQAQKEEKSGLELLANLRVAFPALPVIMITSSTEVWTHRRLINLGADAVWMKEGLDDSQAPLLSYYNVIRLLELIRRVSDNDYQIISRLGKKLQLIQRACNAKEKNFWWQKSEVISWPKGNVSNGFLGYFSSFASPLKINQKLPSILTDAILLLKGYLRLTKLEFDESTFGKKNRARFYESTLAKSIVIQMAKSIELIHGYEMSHKNSDKINSKIIGGIPLKPYEKTIEAVRGDWIAFALYQLRNECAHYFGNVNYTFEILNKDPRSLVYFAAHLFAYLSNPYQPFHSVDGTDFPWNKYIKTRLLPPEYLEELIKKHQTERCMQEHNRIYNEILFNGE